MYCYCRRGSRTSSTSASFHRGVIHKLEETKGNWRYSHSISKVSYLVIGTNFQLQPLLHMTFTKKPKRDKYWSPRSRSISKLHELQSKCAIKLLLPSYPITMNIAQSERDTQTLDLQYHWKLGPKTRSQTSSAVIFEVPQDIRADLSTMRKIFISLPAVLGIVNRAKWTLVFV